MKNEPGRRQGRRCIKRTLWLLLFALVFGLLLLAASRQPAEDRPRTRGPEQLELAPL